jgi:DtxR family Mn-dependent transcriptional regulator
VGEQGRSVVEERMSHDKDMADQDVEEIAEEIFTLTEEGHDRVSDLKATSQVAGAGSVLAELVRRNFARIDGDRVFLTPRGQELAERQVRRHRLAEVLFATVLEVRDERAINRTACVMEHVLGAGLADSICSFLGHPQRCPHGKAIPSGPCCRTLNRSVEPLVQPLDRLPVGQSGRIVYIAPREPARLVKLSNLGVVPGATVRLQQRSPAAVIRVGETTIAVEPEIAAEIYVKAAL